MGLIQAALRNLSMVLLRDATPIWETPIFATIPTLRHRLRRAASSGCAFTGDEGRR